MFYRVFVVGIVAFWVWMTALLVRLEFAPGETQMLPVPTSHVWKLLFRHEELSALTLYNGRQRLGELHLQPRHRTTAGGPYQQLTGTGAFTLTLPGASVGQRMVIHGTLDLNEREEVQRVELAANFHEPNQTGTGTTILFDGQPPRDHWHYAIRYGKEVKENSGTVDALLDDPDLRALGFDPKMFGQMSRQQVAATSVTARHGTLHMNGEDVETYVVTVRQGGGLESSIHLNQLGQILAVKTFLGYDLYDDAFAP